MCVQERCLEEARPRDDKRQGSYDPEPDDGPHGRQCNGMPEHYDRETLQAPAGEMEYGALDMRWKFREMIDTIRHMISRKPRRTTYLVRVF